MSAQNVVFELWDIYLLQEALIVTFLGQQLRYRLPHLVSTPLTYLPPPLLPSPAADRAPRSPTAMLCKRRVAIGIFVAAAFVMCSVNLHLLSRHHQLRGTDDIFLTHLNTNSSAIKRSKQVAVSQSKKLQSTSDTKEVKSAYTSTCFRPTEKLRIQPNKTLPFPVINLGFPKMGKKSFCAVN